MLECRATENVSLYTLAFGKRSLARCSAKSWSIAELGPEHFVRFMLPAPVAVANTSLQLPWVRKPCNQCNRSRYGTCTSAVNWVACKHSWIGLQSSWVHLDLPATKLKLSSCGSASRTSPGSRVSASAWCFSSGFPSPCKFL